MVAGGVDNAPARPQFGSRLPALTPLLRRLQELFRVMNVLTRELASGRDVAAVATRYLRGRSCGSSSRLTDDGHGQCQVVTPVLRHWAYGMT